MMNRLSLVQAMARTVGECHGRSMKIKSAVKAGQKTFHPTNT
jgi:hypothetical protein